MGSPRGLPTASGLCPNTPRRVTRSPFRNPRPSFNFDAKMKTGIHIERCNVLSAEAHNLRKPEYLAAVERSGKKTYDIYRDKTATNRHWRNPKYPESLATVLDNLRTLYTEKIGQAPQEKDTVRLVTDKKTGLQREIKRAGWSPIREGVCPVKSDTQLQDFKPFIQWCEKHSLSVISIDIHHDEGHTNPNGEREYNHHAHIVFDWIDHNTGKSCKLSREDMAEMQTVIAASLAMERGESRTLTGKEHLSPAQYREQAAAATVKELQERADNLTERIRNSSNTLNEILASIPQKRKEKAREAAKAALWDTTAKLANFFGGGAIAEAEKEREEARRAAAEAENEKSIALRDAKDAIKTRETYGSEQYNKGYSKGRKDEKEAADKDKEKLREDIKRLKQQMTDNEANYIENDNKLQKLQETLSNFIVEVGKHLPWIDGNLLQNIKTMKEAKMKDDEISAVVRKGRAMVMLPNTSEETEVSLAYIKNEHEKGIQVWFNHLSYPAFLRKLQEKLKALKPAAPKTPTPPKRTPKMGL